MSQRNNLTVIREKIAILESKRNQLMKTVDTQLERVIAKAQIPIFSKNGEDEICLPFVDLLDQAIKVCSDIFQYANQAFSFMSEAIESERVSLLKERNSSRTSSASSTSNMSPCSQDQPSSQHLKGNPMHHSGAPLDANEQIRDIVKVELLPMNETLLNIMFDMKKIRSELNILTGRKDIDETQVKQPFDLLSPSRTSGRPEYILSGTQDIDETLVKQPLDLPGSRSSGRPERPENFSPIDERQLSSPTITTARQTPSSGRTSSSQDRQTIQYRRDILDVPTEVIGEGYAPNVFYHGLLTKAVTITGAKRLRCDEFYVLDESWYKKESGIFIAPYTGQYRCYVDVKARYIQGEEETDSACVFRLSRLSRETGHPIHWSTCELKSMWGETDFKTSEADDETTLFKNDQICFEACTTNGQWETYEKVILMIVYNGA